MIIFSLCANNIVRQMHQCLEVSIINFLPLQLTDKPIFDAYYHGGHYENSHSNFTTMYIWRDAYQLRWNVINDCLCILGIWNNEHFILTPLGDRSNIGAALDQLERYFLTNGWHFEIHDVESSLVTLLNEIMPHHYTFSEDRDNYDYVYNVQDLITLGGRKYHSKKNHTNSFKRLYSNFKYQPLSPELTAACLAFEYEWHAAKNSDDSTLDLEKTAIIETMNHFDALKICGGVISVAGKIIAFTIGEQITEDTAVIHVEKANPIYKGIYAVINQEFCKHAWSHLKLINRQEDLGIPELKQAKLSYHPTFLVEKSVATIR